MDDSTRHQFNMKVLRRHDSAIVDIIESASFVVLYSHDGEWTKTGIEGPMFLYRRSANPPYGFFVLNRNGVENFSANLTEEDDLELTPQFIIYRASKGEDVIGIWIFEPDQRESIGQQMLKLQATPLNTVSTAIAPTSNPPPPTASTSQSGQSISLDALFGKPVQQSNGTGSTNSASGLSLLDSIFDSVSPSRTASQPAPPPAAAIPPPFDAAEGLKAMLGLPSIQKTASSAPPNPSSNPNPNPSGLEALFASASVSTPTMVPPEKKKKPTKVAANGETSGTTQSAADIVDASLQSKGQSDAAIADSLSRRDFVREVLSLIHTDKDFVDDLYQRYQNRTS